MVGTTSAFKVAGVTMTALVGAAKGAERGRNDGGETEKHPSILRRGKPAVCALLVLATLTSQLAFLWLWLYVTSGHRKLLPYSVTLQLVCFFSLYNHTSVTSN